VAERMVSLKRGQQVISISMIPETEGVRRFRLSLPVEIDEIDEQNNTAEITVKIVKRTLRVLLVAGDPSREYMYMVPALLRDPIIELSCFLQSADVDYTQQGNAVVERLPQTVKEWSRYDVAILFDVDPNKITTQQLAGLENMVSNGGGLMIVAGRSHGMAKLVQVHAARIRGLLPVEVDKNLHLNHDRIYDQPYHIRRTSKGQSHPIMLASAAPVENETAWSSFGELDFYWHHPVSSPKPKAVVLLEKDGDNPTGSSNSLMAIHRYVDGAVFFSSINSVWRWRYPSESYDYDRLWTRVIRYLGEARLLGTQQQVSLTTDRRVYSPGEDVEISLRVLDPALFAQLADQQIYVSVTGKDNDQYMVSMVPAADGEPVYLGEYRARRVGDMTIGSRQAAPDADSEAKPLFDVKHGFQVRVQSLEDKDTSADLESMQQLSERTGGKYFNYRTMVELDSLLAAIPTNPQIITEIKTIEVWDGMTFLLIFLVLVSIELSLRKWWGLL
ncbi:MAG: putative membrane protein, partial [Pirellulaceae bacterium]